MADLNLEINGTVDTGVDVLTNINRIADAALCYVSWDLSIGKWSVIIKEPDTTVADFDDTNIVGAITVTGSGLDQTYNSAMIRFPHKDLASETDYVTVAVDAADRYLNELDHQLNMSTQLVNDPVHAQQMASIELQNSRLDKVIKFKTDFSEIGITGGDLITVSNSALGFSGKLFRVQRVREVDGTDGSLLIEILAQEYQDIYSSALERTDADRTDGITPYEACEELQAADDEAAGGGAGECKWCYLGEKYLGSQNVTSDAAGLYAETNRDFFSTQIYDTQQDPDDPAIPASVAINDFDVLVDLTYLYETGISFTAPKAGWYKIGWRIGRGVILPLIDSFGPNDIRFKTQLNIRKAGKLYNRFESQKYNFIEIDSAETFIAHCLNRVDFHNRNYVLLSEGETIDLVVRYKTDYHPGHPELASNVQVAWVGYVDIWHINEEDFQLINNYFS